MATPRLIDAYLDALRSQLPADIVAELADGLTETYDHHRDRGLEAEAAARAAISEFGTPEQLTAAFAHGAPGRQLARHLLTTGPLVGTCWATALVTTHAWQTMPTAAHVALPLALLPVIGLLTVACRGPYRGIRAAALTAGTGVILLDSTALALLALLSPTLTWPLMLAATASFCRIAFTLRALPHLRTAT
ncbi:permease prefix domain 1-containing protein [Streptomyces sp. CA-106131]|uniref:permease prefix domain 1-containing protein n=1 Tax=Streptomyces sp. CA-106131 TaxID=3240045 RepID=UPI003D8F78C9